MGLSGISPLSLFIILLIALVLFGSGRLKKLGGDLGEAIKSFKNSVSDEEKKNKSIE